MLDLAPDFVVILRKSQFSEASYLWHKSVVQIRQRLQVACFAVCFRLTSLRTEPFQSYNINGKHVK